MRPQRRADAAGAIGQIAVGGDPLAADDGDMIGKALGLLAQQVEQGAAVGGLFY